MTDETRAPSSQPPRGGFKFLELPDYARYPTVANADLTFPAKCWNRVTASDDIPDDSPAQVFWAAKVASREWGQALNGSLDWRNIDDTAFKLAVTDVVLKYQRAVQEYSRLMRRADLPFEQRSLEELQRDMLSLVPTVYTLARGQFPSPPLALGPPPSLADVESFVYDAVHCIRTPSYTINDNVPDPVPLDVKRLGRFSSTNSRYTRWVLDKGRPKVIHFGPRQPPPYSLPLAAVSASASNGGSSITTPSKRVVPEIKVQAPTPLHRKPVGVLHSQGERVVHHLRP